MRKLKSVPNYSIEKLNETKAVKGQEKPQIVSVNKLEVNSPQVNCMKGDCCKDCPGNYIGG
jgi:hypothetical protein